METTEFIWAVMFKLGGNNMAGDAYLTTSSPPARRPSDSIRFSTFNSH